MGNRFRAVLADPARKKRRPAQRYLLTGIVDSPAGDPMIGRPDRGAGGVTDRRTYGTRTPARQHVNVDADDLEAMVVEMVLTALDDAALPAAPAANHGGEEVATLEADLAELAALRGAGTVSMAEWLAARGPLLERLEVAKTAAGGETRPAALEQLLSQPGAVSQGLAVIDFRDTAEHRAGARRQNRDRFPRRERDGQPSRNASTPRRDSA